MRHFTLKVTSKGQVTLPAEFRKALGIEAGSTLSLDIDESGRAAIQKKRPFEDLIGSAKVDPNPLGRPFIQADIDEAAAEAMAEQEERIAGQRKKRR